MARLTSIGPGHNSVTAGMEFSSFLGTAPTIVTNPDNANGRALLFSNPAINTSALFQFALADLAADLYFRAYVRFSAAPTTNTLIFLTTTTSNTVGKIGVLLNTDRTLQLYNIEDSVTIGTASTALAVDTRYRLEVRINTTTLASTTVDGRIDGTSFGSGTVNLAAGIAHMGVGCSVAQAAHTFHYSDLAINDTTLTTQNAWPGAGQLAYLRPNAAGDSNTWEKSGGAVGDANNYLEVDEDPPDEATTYLKRITLTVKVDDYNLQSSSDRGIGSGATITLVHVGIRGGATVATASNARYVVLRIKGQASGTVTKGPLNSNQLHTITWTTNTVIQPKTYKLTSYTNPQTGAAWTPSTIDTMQIGVENQISNATETRVSALWAIVEYVPAAGPAAQSIGLNAIASTAALPNQTITPGAVTIGMPAIAPAASLSNPTVRDVQAINTQAIASAATLHNPTVAPGAATVSLTTMASGAALYQPTVAPQAVSLALHAIAATGALYQPAITLPAVTVALQAIAGSAALSDPSITVGAVTLALQAIAATAALYQPSVAGSQLVSFGTITSAAQLYNPTVTPGAVAVALNAIAAAAQLYAPSIAVGAVTLALNAIASGATLYQPGVSVGAVSIALQAIAASAALSNPTISQGALAVALNHIASTAALYGPSMSPGAVTISLNHIASMAALHNPSINPGAVSVALQVITSLASLYQPAVTPGAVAIALQAIISAALLYPPSISATVTGVNMGTIASTVTLSGPHLGQSVGLHQIASSVTLSGPSVLAAAVDIVTGTIASVAMLYPPSATPGAVSIALPTLDSATVIYSPQITVGAVMVLMQALASGAVLYEPHTAFPTVDRSLAPYQGTLAFDRYQVVRAVDTYQAALAFNRYQVVRTFNRGRRVVLVFDRGTP